MSSPETIAYAKMEFVVTKDKLIRELRRALAGSNAAAASFHSVVQNMIAEIEGSDYSAEQIQKILLEAKKQSAKDADALAKILGKTHRLSGKNAV